MAGDPGMVAQLRVERAPRAGDDVDVDVMGRQRFGVVLHAGTAPQVTENNRRYSHTLAQPRGA